MDENAGGQGTRETDELGSPEPRDLKWALVLGSSSGFGAATAAALAEEAGLSIVGVHLRRPTDQDAFEETKARIEAAGCRYIPFNMNAANPDRRAEALDKVAVEIGGSGFKVVLHSLAFGTLKPYIAPRPEEAITQANMEMTLDVMAHSLVYWVQDCVARGLLGRGSRIFAMTSAGSVRVVPNYGAVSAAKAALESHIRQLAYELAPRGITANSIMAGVTDTPALRKIPGNERLVEGALARNPSGRLTTPQDVARFIALLAKPGAGADWLTGNVLRVDGGEEVSS
ncbi:MAG TPA: SDR family oxidoreductase [Chloroflexia bacterium]|jgi:NAD(P)-dependent dehydrogenase (short-subunit alcohol dehydrogenase family)